MAQAIHVKWKGPTNAHGARNIASCDARRTIIPQDYNLDPAGNACRAARVLATEMRWFGEWVGGTLPDGTWAFVCVKRTADESVTVRVP